MLSVFESKTIKVLAILIPIIISSWALRGSWRANDIAKDALVTQYAALAVGVVKNDSSYFLVKEASGGMEITVSLKITNNGFSTAQNIIMGNVEVITEETSYSTDSGLKITTSKTKPEIKPSGPITLSPTEPDYFELKLFIPVLDKGAVIDAIEKFKNDDFDFPFNFEIFYESGFNFPTKCKLGVSMIINSRREPNIKYRVNPCEFVETTTAWTKMSSFILNIIHSP